MKGKSCKAAGVTVIMSNKGNPVTKETQNTRGESEQLWLLCTGMMAVKTYVQPHSTTTMEIVGVPIGTRSANYI